MDIRLNQSQSQKLVLSPQIQQYLKLLQLPIVELQTAIEQELIENPVLEDVRDEDGLMEIVDPTENESVTDKQDELEFQEKVDVLNKLDEEFQDSFFSQGDSRLESIEDLEKKQNYREASLTKEQSLSEFLEWQLSFHSLSTEEKKVATEMIDSLTDDGYLLRPLSDFQGLFNISEKECNDILALLQTFDPPGVFGQSLKEVLLLQIERKEASEQNKLAYQIIESQYENFEKRDYQQIAKQLGVSIDRVNEALQVVLSLEPKPGRIFYQNTNLKVVPDVSIYPPEEPGDDYIIEILDETVPQLRVSKYYKDLAKNKETDKETREYIKQKINAGFWFIKAIEQRKSTLRLIVEELVDSQKEFFEKGFSHLKPLTLKDVGEKVNIHESTVSRALSGKYVNTPQGTIPFKSFFSNKIETEDGEYESQKSIMEKIKQVIDAEDPKKPLSDAKLVDVLKEDGFKIARRTVAKYRELMKILPSHLRKQK